MFSTSNSLTQYFSTTLKVLVFDSKRALIKMNLLGKPSEQLLMKESDLNMIFISERKLTAAAAQRALTCVCCVS